MIIAYLTVWGLKITFVFASLYILCFTTSDADLPCHPTTELSLLTPEHEPGLE